MIGPNLRGNHIDGLKSLQVLTRALLNRDCRSITGRHSYIPGHLSWGREWCHPQRQLPRRRDDEGTWMRKNPTPSVALPTIRRRPNAGRPQKRVGRCPKEISVASKFKAVRNYPAGGWKSWHPPRRFTSTYWCCTYIFRCFCLGPWQWVEAMRKDPAIRKWIVLKAEMVHSPAPGNPVSTVSD